MENIKDLLQIRVDKSPPSARSFREDLINKFIEEILAGNRGTQWEPKTEAALKRFKRGIAIKINTNPFLRESWQLEGFFKYCKEAKNFGARFNGSLNTNEKKQLKEEVIKQIEQ
jgi:hypothetical protein